MTREVSSKGSSSSASTLAMEVLQGHDSVVSFPGTSQFRVQGVSACGLAALNFARIAFRISERCTNLAEALDKIASRETVEEVIAICAGWSSELHLEVEDISLVPLFKESLKRSGACYYGPPGSKHFKNILRDMQSIEKSAAAIITRPPEIIACFKVADPSMPGNSAFVVFDSHPRPSHPHGAGLIFSSSLENTIKILRGILHVDKNLLSSPDLQWEAQLLTNCSGHIFLGRDGKFDVDRSMVESSLTVLALRSEIKELTKQNDDLAVQNRYLEKEARVLEGAIQQERLNAARGASYAAAVLHRQEQKPSWRHYSQPNAVAGPSRIPSNNRAPGYHGAGSIFADNPPPVPARKPSPYPFEDVLEKVQIDLLEEDRRAGQAVQNLNIAFQLQQKFDAEDAALRQQQAALSCLVQRTFKCQICLEELPEDDAARVDACGHMLCRACMREFISAKIAEHRFPILCPICVANGGSAGEISGLLVEQIGITESEYGIWIGMELSQFSILLHCRKCNRSAFVDRDDYNDMPNLGCPMRDCDHVWCKECHRTIPIGGPKHSCDGSSELDHLMKQQGWHYCPNCKTPIQKDHGCNHMTCIASGCNTHFCYICGGLIVRSALREEIGKAVTEHYTKCQLFEVPE